ncbi:MAG: hypothetical protein RL122_3023 [Pseudomonadota bacterium]|jgi:hypothetical protein
MLELRPSCENCNKPLPPHATDAMICSFECTFCSDCVSLLGNTCPNCGGGFVPRPIRPVTNWKGDNYLGHDRPSSFAPWIGRRISICCYACRGYHQNNVE